METITFYSTQPYDIESFDQINKNFGFQLNYFEEILRSHNTHLAEGTKAVCIFVNDHCHAGIIEKLANEGVKIIALRSAGFNNVDLEAAKKFGITVVRVPAYSPEAVAEHAIAMILTLNRKIHKAYNRVREQNFSLKGLLGFDLYGKTIGIVGTGKIGIAFGRIMKGFGCELLAFDPYPNEELIENGVKYVELDELLNRSDIVSLHCPLIKDTQHMINKESLAKMKPGAMLVNTSRGGLVKTEDTIESLKKHHLGGLAIDVYEQEEKIFFRDLSTNIIQDDTLQRLMSFPNVLITAHQAFFTHEALEQIATTTLNNIKSFFDGEPVNVLNP